MTIQTAPFYTEALTAGDRVVALYPNHRWGAGVVVEVRTEPGLKPYVVQSDKSGVLGHFYADGIVREVPAAEIEARRAWRNPAVGYVPDADLLNGLDSVAGFLADDDDRDVEYAAVTEARKRIAAGL